MSKDARIPTAIWSSDWSENAGQTIVTRRVFEHQPGIEWVKTTYGAAGLASIIGVFGATAKLYWAALNRRFAQVYVVSSRSLFGFIRDLPPLLLTLFGARVVVHVHGSDIVHLLGSSPLSWLARRLYRRSTMIVPSEHLVAEVRQFTGSPPVVCENFVANDALDRPAPAKGAGTEEIRVVWNSNIMSSKGVFDVAQAVKIARQSDPRFTFHAIGAPIGDIEMSKDEAHAQIEELAALDWVTYSGPVSPNEALRTVRQADICLFPSRYPPECQPLALIQAMMLAKPIVANDTPALRATLKGYPAIFLSSPTPEELAAVLLRFAQGDRDAPEFDPARLAAAAAAARKRFSTERFDRAMAEILTCIPGPQDGEGT